MSLNSVRVLALSAYDDRQYILSMLANGASGYLTKDEASHILVEAVRGVTRGEQGWFSQRVAARMATWMRDKPLKKAKLTEQEVTVMRLGAAVCAVQEGLI